MVSGVWPSYCAIILKLTSAQTQSRACWKGITCRLSGWRSATVRGPKGVLGGSFGVRYSDSWDLNRNYIGELVKKTRVM